MTRLYEILKRLLTPAPIIEGLGSKDVDIIKAKKTRFVRNQALYYVMPVDKSILPTGMMGELLAIGINTRDKDVPYWLRYFSHRDGVWRIREAIALSSSKWDAECRIDSLGLKIRKCPKEWKNICGATDKQRRSA